MRLLILCEYPTLLGGERSMLAMLPAVRAAGFEVHVAGPPEGPLAAALAHEGVYQQAWRTRDAHGVRLRLEKLRSDLAVLLRQLRPALVHANSLSTSRISGPVASECGILSVGHLRDIAKLAPQAIHDINRHDQILAVSHATREFHIAQGIDPARCAVVYNGVDLDLFCPRPATGFLHEELQIPAKSRLVVCIGQLGLRKGTEVALSAALDIAADFLDVHWMIVGERTSNKQESVDFEVLLHSIAAENAFAGRVHFLGSRADIPQLLNECVLLVHAARQEPLGRVLLEAAASGLAVVATDVGGTKEIFSRNQDGAILVPADDREALARAMGDVLSDDKHRQSLGSAGRRRAQTAFDIRHASGRLIAEYRCLFHRSC
jgi:glycosyltransferase involved in cell wall biosynthesis